MKIHIAFVFGLTMLIWLFASEVRSEEVQVEVPPPVAKCVSPILDTVVDVRRAEKKRLPSERLESNIGRLLGRLIADKNPTTDEALVVLVQFYIGEANSEDILHEVTKRGQRMIPFLRKYMRGSAHIPGKYYPASIRANPQTSIGFMETAIESIKDGKVMFED